MSKYIILQLLCMFGFKLLSQQIVYQPIFLNQCTDSISEEQSWWLYDIEGKSYHANPTPSDKVKLPKPGEYFLVLDILEEPIPLNIEKYGITIDTFYTEKVELISYLSNPPHSEFIDCGTLANGKINDFYYNGQIRLSSTFVNGQPIDTLKEFYRSGVIQDLFIPKKNKWQRIHYFPDGQIHSDYNSFKRYSKVYYESGKLKEFYTWNKKFHREEIRFFKSGQVKRKSSKRSLTSYYSNGAIKNQTSREPAFLSDKIFVKKKPAWSTYQCNLFDSLGHKLAHIQYSNSSFINGFYPDSISQIREYLFNEIILYKDNQEFNRFIIKSEVEDTILVFKLTLYEKKKELWIEKEVVPAKEVYQLLVNHLKGKEL